MGTAVKGSASHAPWDIGGCVLALRADLGISLTSGRVSAWADQSGSGNSLSEGTAGNRPIQSTAGGRASVLFAGATERIGRAFTALADGGAYTVFAVARRLSAGAADVLLAVDSAGGLGNGFACYLSGAANQYICRASDIARTGNFSDVAGTWAAADVGTHAVLHVHQLYARSTMRDRVGGQRATTKIATPVPTALRIGLGLDGSYPFHGHVMELDVWNRALGADELNTLNAYVASRYGL